MNVPSPYGRGLRGEGNKNENRTPWLLNHQIQCATLLENFMWQILRAKQFINLILRREHVDQTLYCHFYCHDIGLVIALDGSQYGMDDAIEYDAGEPSF